MALTGMGKAAGRARLGQRSGAWFAHDNSEMSFRHQMEMVYFFTSLDLNFYFFTLCSTVMALIHVPCFQCDGVCHREFGAGAQLRGDREIWGSSFSNSNIKDLEIQFIIQIQFHKFAQSLLEEAMQSV